MLKHFIKYQSLGNDFVLYDWYKKPLVFVQNTLKDAHWNQFVCEACDRHFGVGADGVLVIKSTAESSFPEMLIFNADGSQAQMCLNGLRCAAHYLFTHHGVQKNFKIMIGQQIVDCLIAEGKSKNDPFEVITTVPSAVYGEKVQVQITAGSFEGHVVSVGNPHLVILQKCENHWLSDHGKDLESHMLFPQRTNVEFVWEDTDCRLPDNIKKAYKLLVYERGVGITLACSSGAAAALWTLYTLGRIQQDEHVLLTMLGGTLIGSIDQNKNIMLRASAEMVFSGDLEHKE